jgi:hypothetical protein
MPSDFEKYITAKYHKTWLKTGGYYSLYHPKSIAGHAVALIGLGIGAKYGVETFLIPYYHSTMKPGITKFWNCLYCYLFIM